MKRLIALSILLVLGAIQFIHPARNIAAPGPNPNAITVLHPTPPAVQTILAKACYDCHSDTTRYPWYANVQPVAWWLNHHITDGKRHLNFSQFGAYPAKRALKKLDGALDEIHDGGMPLWSYTLIHRDAKLTAAEVAALEAWVKSVQQDLGAE